MPKERNKADGYREKAYEGDTKAMNNLGAEQSATFFLPTTCSKNLINYE